MSPCLYLGFSLRISVVRHAIQAPLRVDLLSPPVIEPGEVIAVLDVGKPRINRADSLAVKLSAFTESMPHCMNPLDCWRRSNLDHQGVRTKTWTTRR